MAEKNNNNPKKVFRCGRIKATIWDNGGVLGHVTCGSFPHLWAERLSAPLEDVIRVLTGPESDLLDLGEISKDEYFGFIIRDLGLPAEKKLRLNYQLAISTMIKNYLSISIIRKSIL